MKEYRYLINVKGISASGKSTRLFMLLDFLKNQGYTFEDFMYKSTNGKVEPHGLFIKELNLIILGKYYVKHEVFRFQGFDSVSGRQATAKLWSDFIEDVLKNHNLIIEGAGITGSFRFRPAYLKARSPQLDLVANYYYNYEEEDKPEYLARVKYRSGKEPAKDSMWLGRSGMVRDFEMSLDEEKELGDSMRCALSYNSYSVPLSHLGEKFFEDIYTSPDSKKTFVEFCERSDYININKYSGKAIEDKSEGIYTEVIKTTKPKTVAVKTPEVALLDKSLMYSVFPDTSTMDRNSIHWEEHLYNLTPVQQVGEMYFKREDTFAPLGYGGINGSKLRQCIWMVSQFKPIPESKLISGASLKSPQLPMGTCVAKHYGMGSIHIVGATNPKSSFDRDMVKMATWFGSEFQYEPVGYNPYLQKKAKDLLEERGNIDYYLNYGITPPKDASDDYVHGFHATGAFQVQNIPVFIENIIIPAGSTNSTISILYGLTKFISRFPNLKNVYLIGIGPNKMKLIEERLNIIRKVSGVNTKNFLKTFDSPSLTSDSEVNCFNLNYVNIFEEGYTDYQQEMPFTYNGLEFHPTYEGKVMSYLTEKMPSLISDTSMLWIIGSKPRMSSMNHLTPALGDYPTQVNVYRDNSVKRKLKDIAEVKTESVANSRGTTSTECPDNSTLGSFVQNTLRTPLITPEDKNEEFVLTKELFIGETGIPEGRAAIEVSNLKVGDDFREPKFRREVFLKFYEFHLQYKSHPGAVYYVFQHLWDKYKFTEEQKLWFCFINGCTQNPCTTWVIFNRFPNLYAITFEDFESWHRANWKRLQYDIDRRYQKGHMVEMWQDYMKNLNGKTQVEFFSEGFGTDQMSNFNILWDKVINGFKWYGRLSTYSYLEYLRIAGVNINCPSLMLYEKDGTVSPRNGLCKVLGRDDLDWHKGNPDFKGYGRVVMEWLEKESHILLSEAQLRFHDRTFSKDVNFFTLESTLCCYKSWFRKNRRYPNIYQDMFYDRIVNAESEKWDHVDFQDFWDARSLTLPDYLRMESVKTDLGIHPLKQNWFRETGEVIMMDKDFPVFVNHYAENPEVKRAKRRITRPEEVSCHIEVNN